MKRKSPSEELPKILVRLPPAVHEKITELARREKRSRAAQVAFFVEKMLETAA